MSEKRFFCIRGFMKSGTNWLGGLLNRHPRISSHGEFHWQEVMDPVLQREKSSLFRQPEVFQTAIEGLREAWRQTVVAANDPAAEWVGDRTPHRLAPLVDLNASYISIIRDGRDVLVSRVFHLYNNPQVTRIFQRDPGLRKMLQEFRRDPWFFSKSPELLLSHEELVRDSARWWREHLENDRETVAQNPSLKVRFVQYEALHARTHEVCDELFQFLGADPAEAPPIEGEIAPGFERERPDSFFRKGVVGDWKNYFRPDSRTWFMEEAGDELVRQGYVGSDRQWEAFAAPAELPNADKDQPDESE